MALQRRLHCAIFQLTDIVIKAIIKRRTKATTAIASALCTDTIGDQTFPDHRNNSNLTNYLPIHRLRINALNHFNQRRSTPAALISVQSNLSSVQSRVIDSRSNKAFDLLLPPLLELTPLSPLFSYCYGTFCTFQLQRNYFSRCRRQVQWLVCFSCDSIAEVDCDPWQ